MQDSFCTGSRHLNQWLEYIWLEFTKLGAITEKKNKQGRT